MSETTLARLEQNQAGWTLPLDTFLVLPAKNKEDYSRLDYTQMGGKRAFKNISSKHNWGLMARIPPPPSVIEVWSQYFAYRFEHSSLLYPGLLFRWHDWTIEKGEVPNPPYEGHPPFGEYIILEPRDAYGRRRVHSHGHWNDLKHIAESDIFSKWVYDGLTWDRIATKRPMPSEFDLINGSRIVVYQPDHQKILNWNHIPEDLI